MDMEKPLKFEGECFGLETDSDFYGTLGFIGLEGAGWDQQDLPERRETTSMGELVEDIRGSADIAYTPLEELVELARFEQNWDPSREDELRRILKKTKLVEKRHKAKLRVKSIAACPPGPQLLHSDDSDATASDIKKKKNRLSAQISRDRKKEYYSKLEIENHKLQQEIDRLNSEKQGLMAEKELLNKKCATEGKSPIVSLLLFLGIIFFYELLHLANFSRSKGNSEFVKTKISLSSNQKKRIEEEMDRLGVKINLQSLENSHAWQQGAAIPKKLEEPLSWVMENYF